jgi:hypothetical protein
VPYVGFAPASEQPSRALSPRGERPPWNEELASMPNISSQEGWPGDVHITTTPTRAEQNGMVERVTLKATRQENSPVPVALSSTRT